MPIKNDPNAVRHQIHHALRDNILSNQEAKRLLDNIKEDGVTDEEVQAVVDTLKSAMAGGPDSVRLDVTSSSRRKRVNRFLGQLNELNSLPLDAGNAGGTGATGSVDWLQLMTMQGNASATVLERPTFSGSELGVDANGEISLGDARLDLNAELPSDEMREALWGLSRGGQLDGMDASSREVLNDSLLGVLQKHIDVPNDQPGKFRRLTAATAATATLVQDPASWDSTMVDSLLDSAENAPTPMIQSLLLRGLDKANLSPEQKTRLGGIERHENEAILLEKFDAVHGETAKAGWTGVKGEAAEFALNALSFAKTENSVNNVMEGMAEWKDLNNDYRVPWDGEEISNMNQILETYVDKYPQTAFQFGTFSKNAPKEIAKVTNARVMEDIAPQLEQDPPALQGFPLTREQADYVKTLLPNVRDKESVDNLVKTLGQANAMFSSSVPSTYMGTEMPTEAMAPAAFDLFQRNVESYNSRAESTKDGKLQYSDFLRDFNKEVVSLHKTLRPRLAGLEGQPPRWGDVELSPEAATYVKETLANHMRSSMSVDNIGRALELVGEANGGAVGGASLEQFQGIMTDYMSNWPDLQVFDFNKLERITKYKVEGREVPLCTVNGQTVGLAEFYGKVGADVANAFDENSLRHGWMADRWGYRARNSVEMLDVVAEQTIRGEGPVAALRQEYPNAEIEIQATGRDMAHEQFLYVVKENGRSVKTYAQGSDGELGLYTGRHRTPVLFTSTVGEDGELNVQIPDTIESRRYPLQTTYAVGDKIDVHWRDPDAVEAQDKGEEFTTPSRVMEGEILSYDASGNYEVKFTTPSGDELTKTLSSSEIRKTNNPHYFKSKSSYFSDVTININTDEQLKTFLEEAQPIIESYLPTDGSLVDISAEELAKRQKDCIQALMDYTSERVKYPASKDSSNIDAGSKRYHELDAGYNRFSLGELVKIQKGVCRHQCILEHLLLQQAGIESRLASGAANTSSGDFRGYHIWTEVSLADGQRYLSDQTWDDATIPLWDGAYSNDKRRVEMYRRTARYDSQIEMLDR